MKNLDTIRRAFNNSALVFQSSGFGFKARVLAADERVVSARLRDGGLIPIAVVRVEGDGFDIIAMRGGCFYISADGRICVGGNVGETRADSFHGLEEGEET